MITFVKVVQQKIYLSAIYDKSTQSSITDKELERLSKTILGNN
ncbi:MAG: hypothetical protein KF781_02240 [Chitinophagaceae bacterium]|nr:hypothetical protein [Chitinophagaceae bacterium]MCW5904329.1 hypothetical protein [Chitinophagaceae bacterium]